MARNVPIDLLRSFVTIVDAGSMAQATETIFLTPSALSLQMKRLEDLLGQRVFRRQGRSLTLTAAGEELLGLARQLLGLNDRIFASLASASDPEPIQVGLVQDFADTILPGVLARFHDMHPRARLQLRVGGSAELMELFDRAKCDVVMCLGRPGDIRRGTSRLVREAPMAWIGREALAEIEELPLVLLEQPCAFRTALLETLEREGRSYRIILETPNLPGMRAALRAGLGITCRTRGFALSEDLPIPASGTLPALPDIDTVMLRRDLLGDAATDLADLLEEAAGAAD
jgi:DNA-binding transcriptional LysR family regulator